MSVYRAEKAEYLDMALRSVFNQTLKAGKVVLVKDGLLTPELDAVIDKWKKCEESLLVLPCEKNQGLAVALNIGLQQINTKYIARMDTDDISLPNRFEKQLEFLKKNPEVDVTGTFIQEIDENGCVIKTKVEYPITHEECYRFFQKRDPMAHPTVMFKDSFFKKINGYYDERFVGVNKQEDSDLWFKGFLNDCKFANIPEVLFQFRRSSTFYGRRTGLKYSLMLLKEKIRRNKKLGYGISAYFYAFAYFIMNQMPGWIKKMLYQFAR